ALNPLDRRVVARAELDGYRIDGVKSFSSGSVGSDLLTFSAWHKASDTALIAALPTRAEGITVNPDWDAFGQRQTDSGTVRFDHV
ncbi:acyl-CoA dehydrogenase family protein, partial [Burkholderia contaminans]